jgi:hypothetical protein
MSSMLDNLMSSLEGDGMETLARQVGTDPAAAKGAVAAALPLILAALSKNAQSPAGAESLSGALRQHDGSLLRDVVGALGSSATRADGAGILGHVFGARKESASDGLSRATGVSSAQGAQILAMLAPLVLAQLGKMTRERGADATDLGGILAGQAAQARQNPAANPSLIESLLDRDGDGSIMDDVGRAGLGMLGSLFEKDRN